MATADEKRDEQLYRVSDESVMRGLGKARAMAWLLEQAALADGNVVAEVEWAFDTDAEITETIGWLKVVAADQLWEAFDEIERSHRKSTAKSEAA